MKELTTPILTKLVGVTFDNCQLNIVRCNVNLPLDLVREADNPYDCNAIRVESAGKKLGYINRDLAEELATIIESGNYTVTCNIDQMIGGGYRKNYGLIIKIYINKKAADEYSLFDMDLIMSNILEDMETGIKSASKFRKENNYYD